MKVTQRAVLYARRRWKTVGNKSYLQCINEEDDDNRPTESKVKKNDDSRVDRAKRILILMAILEILLKASKDDDHMCLDTRGKDVNHHGKLAYCEKLNERSYYYSELLRISRRINVTKIFQIPINTRQ